MDNNNSTIAATTTIIDIILQLNHNCGCFLDGLGVVVLLEILAGGDCDPMLSSGLVAS